MNRPADEVFNLLIRVLVADNGCSFKFTEEQKQEAIPHIEKLIAAGFFADDPNDLDGSFWKAGSPCDDESRVFFASESEAYAALDEILNDIFDGV